ncbi:hypothetical protein SELMODRAFT_236997 [Selaginella moellendorffii]|uniref:DNA polymerase epsilon subunit n=1 Tax=Selaginella moellendorffii TaxID=88036 RepID=D8TGB5_SELML|nr:hypothetical protein SELMODRAFT_236997 [Selaginella moellendorffii]
MEQQQRMRKAQLKFKLRGLTLSVDALKAVLGFLDEQYLPDEEALQHLLAEVDKISLKSNVLSKEAALELISAATGVTSSQQNALLVVDAFKLPRFCYDPIRKMFYRYNKTPSVHGDARSKSALYKDRLQLLHQRLIRDRHFAKPAFDMDGSRSGTCELSSLQSLLGCIGRRWVMGIVSQLEDGRYYLEDLSATIPIDLSQAISFGKISNGELHNCCGRIAASKRHFSGSFLISTCGFPPLEGRNISLSVTAGLDFFGAGALSYDEISRLEVLERKAVNDMFVVISDVWLDDEQTMRNLEVVLDGFENVDVVPSVFILMGNFLSRPCNLSFHSFGELRSHFDKLGTLIASHTRISSTSKFVLIPGPEDPGPSSVLPRPALPSYFTKELAKHVPNVTFASNPCRIRFFSQEIVLFRENLLYRMRRLCIVTPSDEETTEPFEHLVATITHQSHLCPLPLTSQPIVWEYDHAMRLYPTPHTIVLGDRTEQKLFKYMGVTAFSPGSFSVDGTFAAYRPATQEVELSSL